MNRQFLVLLSGRLLQSLIAIASIRLMTTLLDKENVGYNYLIISITSYFSLILINPLGVYLNRHIHEWNRDGILRNRFKQLSGYFLLIAAISIPMVIAGSKFAGIGRGISLTSLAALVAAYVFFSTWSLTLYTSLNMLEHREAFVLLGVVAQVAGLLFGILFVTMLTHTAVGWLLGILAGQTLAGVMAWWYYKSRVFPANSNPAAPSALFKKDLVWFCVPIAITTVFMWTQNHSYRLIIESSLGAEFLASLAVGLGVASSLAGVIESLVTQYFYPGYYAATTSRDTEVRISAWNGFFKNAISIFIPGMAFSLVSAKYIMFFLVAKQFHNTFHVLMFGLAIEFFRMISNVAHVVSYSEKNTKMTIAPYVLGAMSLLAILGAILKDFVHGDKATLILMALWFSGIVTCVTMFVSMRRILKVYIDFKFLFRTLAYCLPLAAGFYFSRFELGIPSMMALCAVLGLYSLFVIWILQKKIRHAHAAV